MNIAREMLNIDKAFQNNNVFEKKIKNNQPLNTSDMVSIDSSINEKDTYFTTLASIIAKKINSANAIRSIMAEAKGIKLPRYVDITA